MLQLHLFPQRLHLLPIHLLLACFLPPNGSLSLALGHPPWLADRSSPA
jgi:hypothetical protein